MNLDKRIVSKKLFENYKIINNCFTRGNRRVLHKKLEDDNAAKKKKE